MASTKTQSTKTPDAIALLKADHRDVESLFEKYETAKSASQKKTLAEKICAELSVHMTIEEEIFYPALEGDIEKDKVEEAFVEHDSAKVLIADILAGGPGDDYYDAKLKVLSEEIEHHVHEEEERSKGLFAQARRSKVDMDELGERLARRKAELLARVEKDGLTPPTAQTLTPNIADAASKP